MYTIFILATLLFTVIKEFNHFSVELFQEFVESISLPRELNSLSENIETYRFSNFPNTSVTFWAESSKHGAVYSNAEEVWPTASAIKIFILLASYIRYKDTWLQVPQELPNILSYETEFQEPLTMFSTSDREEIRMKLWGMTYKELAISMMGVNQGRIGNSAYNSAANILIFLLGGDEGACTEAIHRIDPTFLSVQISRYMLEPRSTDIDNVCSMQSLMSACRLICTNSIPNLSVSDHQAIQDCIQQSTFHSITNFQKHGHLTSKPGVDSWIGWFHINGIYYLYGVNVLNFNDISISDEGSDYYRGFLREQLYLLSLP